MFTILCFLWRLSSPVQREGQKEIDSRAAMGISRVTVGQGFTPTHIPEEIKPETPSWYLLLSDSLKLLNKPVTITLIHNSEVLKYTEKDTHLCMKHLPKGMGVESFRKNDNFIYCLNNLNIQ